MNRSFFVAGVQFRPSSVKTVIAGLTKGQYLYLEPEPDNKFDPNAVKIICSGLKEGDEDVFLGYVPKKFSSEISAALEIDADIECIIEAVNPGAKTWEMLQVVIRDIEDEDEEEDDNEDSIL